MPTPAYLSVTGVKQGLITAGTFTQDSVGNIYQEGHEDQILVQAFSHQVIIPRDPQSGQPTGQRVHKPMMISKVFDKSSPLLFSALTSGEEVKCRLEWLRTSSAGTQEHYFTIELEGRPSWTSSHACRTARIRTTLISLTWKTFTSPIARSCGPTKCPAHQGQMTGVARLQVKPA
jgi:type VI secretion system Hcp family effector